MSDWSQSLIPQSRQTELDQIAGQWSPDDVRSMTHPPQQPNTAAPYLQAARDFAGGFPGGGLTQAFPDLHQTMPSWLDRIGRIFQTQAAHYALNAANIGGLPLVEAFWSPRELDILRRLYSTDKFDPSMLPGRTPSVIRQKAFQMGLKRPEIPPYVRQPGAPVVANDPRKVAQIAEMLKKNMTFDQIASELGGVSGRSVRRYINENLKTRRLRGGPNTPSMPKFSFSDKENLAGDPEFERALEEFLNDLIDEASQSLTAGKK